MYKIPYGESNFKKVVTQQFLYIDKTAYIETLEQEGSNNILLRPRRFGKSLFLSSLWYYYDIRHKEDFDHIFGELFIGKNPTTLKNSYKVLFMDFSGIETDTAQRVEYAFNEEVRKRVEIFLEDYGFSIDDLELIRQAATAADIMNKFTHIIRNEQIYLIIDEYDHFANAILGENLELFSQIIGKGGFVRSFYEIIKTATLEGIVDRLFMTGVTSITLDSLTSGFNIVKNISNNKIFNQAIGFTREEVEIIIEPIVEECDLNLENLMNDLANWYNGYMFSLEAKHRVYNSDMVLYFVQNFNQEECKYPRNMLDENILSDYKKIMQLFTLGGTGKNYQILEDLITNDKIIGLHKTKLDIIKSFDRNDFLGLLYYMGFITITGEGRLDNLIYKTPNYVIQQLYFDYFKVEIEKRNQITIDNQNIESAMYEMAYNNNLSLFKAEIENALQLFSNRDSMQMDEKHIKAVILTILHQSRAYFIKSEMEINNKYPDIMLLERSPYKVDHQFLLELKYAKKKDKQLGWEKKREEGIKQIDHYKQLPEIKNLPKIESYLILTNGTKVEVISV